MTNFRKGDIVLQTWYGYNSEPRTVTICAIDYVRKRVGANEGFYKSNDYGYYPLASIKPLKVSINVLQDIFGPNGLLTDKSYIYQWDMQPEIVLNIDVDINQVLLTVITPDGITVTYRNIKYMHELQHCLEEQGLDIRELMIKTEYNYDR